MSEPPPLDSWYGVGESKLARMRARGALLNGADHIKRGEYYAAYSSFRRALAAVDRQEARRIRGLVHAAAAGVKLTHGDSRGAARQLERARTRLAEGPPTLANVDVDSLLALLERESERAPLHSSPGLGDTHVGSRTGPARAALGPKLTDEEETMRGNGAIDVSVLPYTREIRDSVYVDAGERETLIKVGLWDQPYTPPALVSAMDDAGVEFGLIPAQDFGVSAVGYDDVSAIASEAPDRLFGLAGINPFDIAAGVGKLERAVEELEFVGAHSYPHWFGLAPDDRAFYPFYMKCLELDVPIQIQAGICFQRHKRNVGRADAFDAIAVDFPELRIVAIHTGYPWERELIAAAWKHPNLTIGCDTHHPRTWSRDLIDFIAGDGHEQAVFGTNYPELGFGDYIDAIRALGLDDAALQGLLSENARRIYRLPNQAG